MKQIMCILLSLFWLISGSLSFIYWANKRYDITTNDIPIILFASILGPINYPIGWFVFGQPFGEEKILIHKRS